MKHDLNEKKEIVWVVFQLISDIFCVLSSEEFVAFTILLDALLDLTLNIVQFHH